MVQKCWFLCGLKLQRVSLPAARRAYDEDEGYDPSVHSNSDFLLECQTLESGESVKQTTRKATKSIHNLVRDVVDRVLEKEEGIDTQMELEVESMNTIGSVEDLRSMTRACVRNLSQVHECLARAGQYDDDCRRILHYLHSKLNAVYDRLGTNTEATTADQGAREGASDAESDRDDEIRSIDSGAQ